MKMPGFSAEVSAYRSTATYVAASFGISTDGGAYVEPQFRSHVRRQCGPCVNKKRDCFLWGYECTVEEGGPGSTELGIPGGPGHVSCIPEVFREWEQSC